ncbi:unnamed protein product [Ilex paraguariensis]|uniref:Uncharacterized protein n=1 Tax=Ilex paraguariensis TaxID=185542 RepID=A0ABC8QQ25_9AQUA
MAIEESKVIDSLKIEELVGSLQIFEMNNKKGKSIAIESIKEVYEEFEDEDSIFDNDEEMVLMVKKFRKFLKNSRKKLSKKGKDRPSDKGRIDMKGKGKSKVLVVKWDDSESDSDDSSTSSSGDEVTKYTTFIVTVRDVGEPSTSNREPKRSDDEDLSEGEQLIRKYSRFLKSERKNKEKTDTQKVLKVDTSQIRTNVDQFRTKCLRLVKKVEELEKEMKISKDRETSLEHKVKSLEKDLENEKNIIRSFSEGTNRILSIRRDADDMRGLGFYHNRP